MAEWLGNRSLQKLRLITLNLIQVREILVCGFFWTSDRNVQQLLLKKGKANICVELIFFFYCYTTCGKFFFQNSSGEK